MQVESQIIDTDKSYTNSNMSKQFVKFKQFLQRKLDPSFSNSTPISAPRIDAGSQKDESVISPIFNLPTDLLLELRGQLPLVSQACLALTCKTFLDLFGSALIAPEFRFPRIVFDKKNRIMWKPDASMAIRGQLLRLLENESRRYCNACLKLHPPSEFRPDDLQVDGKLRRCKLCHDGGIVDLCPCIGMTPRYKVQVIAQLKDLKKKKERRHRQ